MVPVTSYWPQDPAKIAWTGNKTTKQKWPEINGELMKAGRFYEGDIKSWRKVWHGDLPTFYGF